MGKKKKKVNDDSFWAKSWECESIPDDSREEDDNFGWGYNSAPDDLDSSGECSSDYDAQVTDANKQHHEEVLGDDVPEIELSQTATENNDQDSDCQTDEKPRKTRPSPDKMAEILALEYEIVLIDDNPYLYDEINHIYRPLDDNSDYTLMRLITPKKYRPVINNKTAPEINSWLRVCEYVHIADPLKQLEREKSIVKFTNTAINVDSLKSVQIGRSSYIRRYINSDYPLNYEPSGGYFDHYLKTAFGDDIEAICLFQEVLGYILGDYRGIKKSFIFYGPSNTGKSVAGNFIKEIVGKEFYSSLTLNDLSKQFGPCHLYGKYLNIGSEIDTSSRASGSLFKRLVGNDEIFADVKNSRSGLEFSNSAAMVFLANTFPRFSLGENASSIAERLVIVPFLNRIERSDWIPNLESKICEESAYVVKFGMLGLQRLKKNNYIFSRCQKSEHIMKEYLIQSFPEIQFIKLYLKADTDGKVATKELDDRYKAFCYNYDVPRASQIRWKDYLSEEFCIRNARGICYKNNNDARGFAGVSFKK